MMTETKLIISGRAVTDALRSAYKRGDTVAMRVMFTNASDSILKKIGEGSLELRGDSNVGLELYTVDQVYIWPTPFKGDRSEEDRVNVTGKSERTIDQIMRGMQINLNSEEYYLAKFVEHGEVYEEK